MPAPADQLLQQALDAHRRGATAEAASLYRRVLEVGPANNVACTNLAVIATAAGDFNEAEAMFRRAVEIKPESAEAHYNLGFILQEQGKLEAAIEVYRRALALRPDMPQAHTNLGVALQHQGKLDDAIAAFRQAIAGNPNYVDAYFNLGVVLRLQGQVDDAAAAYRSVIKLEPSHAAARNNLALILSEAGELAAADVMLRQAVGRWPDYAEGHNNLGALLLDQGRPQEALDALQQALKRTPDYPEAYLNMGNALRELGSLAEAIDAYRRAVELRPTYAEALAQLIYHRARACDWTDAGAEETLLLAVRQNAARIPPFMLIPTAATGADQLLCARKWVEHFAVPEQQVFAHGAAPRPGRLRIGYLSSDFYDHATAYLIAELIERHDRDRCEIHGYSYGPDPGGDMRTRLVSAFDRFTDVDALSHRAAAARIRADDVDILVDLKGHTHRARPKILAFRPAPVQVNYLGYPGTMGAPFIDYIVADEFIVPRDRQTLFAEKLAYLPDCYQPNEKFSYTLTDHHNCVVDRINMFREVLANKNAPQQDRVEALKFLVHFVGDLHQPFHAIDEARGGNDIHIVEFGSAQCGNRPCNLHYEWDIGLLEHSGKSESDYVAQLEQLIVTKHLQSKAGGLAEDWANESFGYAKQAMLKDGGAVDEAYYKANIGLIDERLALAGLRLAKLLNDTLGEPQGR